MKNQNSLSLFGSRKLKITKKYDPSADVVTYLGDRLDLLKSIPNNTVKLVVTSPPYNIGKEYEKRTSLDQYLKEQEKTIKACVRVLSKEGSLCWEVGNHISKDGEVFPEPFGPEGSQVTMLVKNSTT